METDIPFSGFYESLHDSNIDRCIEMMTEDNRGYPIDGLQDKLDINYSPIFQAYVKRYTENFSENFGIKLKYKEMSSPKEYNFTTDRIFCEITLKEVKRLYKETDKAILTKEIKDRFTSYDGFISFYPNDIEKWPKKLADWDLNHVGTLIRAYILTKEIEFENWEPYSMEDDLGNGFLDNLIWENSPNAGRIMKIRDYLAERQERKSA